MDDIKTKNEKGFAKEFLAKLIGFSIPTWISFVLSFISTPIVTRLFIPDEVGKINLFTTYLTMFNVIVLMGLDQAFVRFYNEPPSKNDKRSIMYICLIFTSLMAIFVSAVVTMLGKRLSIEITGELNIIIPVCLIISIFANMFLRFSSLYYRMQNNILLYSVQVIALTIIAKLVYTIVALWSPTYDNAIIAMTIGYSIVAITFFAVQGKELCRSKPLLDRETISELFRFGLPLLPVTLLSWLNNSMGQLMLKKYVDYSAIGVYTSAVSVASIISLLQAGFNTYWAPFVYSSYKTQNEKIKKIHNIITGAMVGFGLIIILGQNFIYILIGEGFRASKSFFPFLLLSPICYTIAETTGLGIGISKKSYLNIAIFVCNVGTNLLLCVILLPRIGIQGAAIAAAFASVVMLIIKTIIGERYYESITSYKKTFSAILIILIAAIVNLTLFDYVLLKYVGLLVLLIMHLIVYKIEFGNVIRYLKNIYK